MTVSEYRFFGVLTVKIVDHPRRDEPTELYRYDDQARHREQEETDGGYMVSPRQAIAFRGKNVTLI
jgi:hypothetical protein